MKWENYRSREQSPGCQSLMKRWELGVFIKEIDVVMEMFCILTVTI